MRFSGRVSGLKAAPDINYSQCQHKNERILISRQIIIYLCAVVSSQQAMGCSELYKILTKDGWSLLFHNKVHM
jgi:hypothetical protein